MGVAVWSVKERREKWRVGKEVQGSHGLEGGFGKWKSVEFGREN